jgi:hypothetical protein
MQTPNFDDIVFENTDNIINEKTFPGTDYEMTFRQGKGFIELMSTHTDKKYSYILRQ